jgi:hypothetical protein
MGKISSWVKGKLGLGTGSNPGASTRAATEGAAKPRLTLKSEAEEALKGQFLLLAAYEMGKQQAEGDIARGIPRRDLQAGQSPAAQSAKVDPKEVEEFRRGYNEAWEKPRP